MIRLPASRDCRLAVVQLRVEPDAREGNLARALAAVDAAAAAGADVVLLPEALPLGWMAATSTGWDEPIPDGLACRALRGAAARHGVHVCSGLVERAGDRLFNAAVLVGPGGDVLLHHRKIHELAIARPLYDRGDRLGVADTPFGRMGLMICADAFSPGEAIARSLAEMGAGLILSPCAWAVPPTHDEAAEPYGELWRGCYGAVARAYGISIAGASCVGPITAGPWAGHACIGRSLVVGPDGEVVATGPYGEGAETTLLVEVVSAPGGRDAIAPAPGSGRG